MTDETKKLFDAPWETDKFVYYRPSGIGEINIRVRSSKNELVAGYVTTTETANRLARLPELYDALNKQTYYRCVDCLRHTAKTIDDIPLNKDIIESGCPKHRQDCGAFDVWLMLRKVRDGK